MTGKQIGRAPSEPVLDYVCPLEFKDPEKYGSVLSDYYFKFTIGDSVTISGDVKKYEVVDCFFSQDGDDVFTVLILLILCLFCSLSFIGFIILFCLRVIV